MSVIQSLVDADEARIVGLVESATDAVESIKVEPSIGLTEGRMDNVQIQRGDLIIDPSEDSVLIATGKFFMGKPVIANQHKKKVIEPELVVVGAQASTPILKRAASIMATKYPDRRVLVYGDAPPKAEEPTEDLSMAESTTSLLAQLAKKADEANPKTDQPLPDKDENLRPASLQVYIDNAKSKKDKTSTGSTVKNEPFPWLKFIKAGGKTEDGTPGNDNPGNEFCPVEAKTRGVK